MTPAARVQAAIEILEGLSASRLPADRYIREFFRARRYAGSKDRAAIGGRVYDVFRHRAFCAWRMGSQAPRALAIGALLREGASADDVATLFSGGGYGPAALTDDERARIALVPQEAPLCVKGEYPQFLEPELTRAFGDRLLDEMAAMQARAPVDLRVNTLKAMRDDVLKALGSDGKEAFATRFSPFAIRLPAGTTGLEKTKLFESGAFEFQDEAAQIAVLLCSAKPGMRVLDLAAGAGGKSLALAALMRDQGEIVASDIDPNRLRQLAPRAERAGTSIIATRDPRPGETFDLVIADAPCSGSGTWRRQPENKWRLTPEGLAQLNRIQDELLARAAAYVKPGGRLVYATCSVLPCENKDRIELFRASHPDFAIRNASQIWRESVGSEPPPGTATFFKATPRSTDTDGFFAAVMQNAG